LLHPWLPHHHFPALDFTAALPSVHNLWQLYRAPPPAPNRGASFLPPPPIAPTVPPFPPPLSHRVAPSRPLRTPRHRPEHRAAVYNLLAPRAVDHHPRTSPPPSFPSGQPHIATELILSVRTSLSRPPQIGAPRCRAALAPLLYRPR
jgi:hypothetical protein